ncbi:P-loop containing nucleoside triphosphate hydrolase protein [Mycena epipterygia]|nr:P-loop containing nucleoside triphosphate hydrolase protein [Mycena epipterygia]
MPHQPTVADIRLNGIIACLNPTVTLLNELTDAFGTPFIRAISSTTLSLIIAVQNVKRNKDECVQLMQNIYGILYAIIDLHIKSEITGNLPPVTLNQIGNFTETLHKIHTFLEAHQEGNKIKYFFRQNEMNTLRKACQAGLEEALKVFKVEAGLIIADNMVEMQKKTEDMHQELMELVANLSDDSNSDRASSIYQSTTGSNNSSNSFALLPAQPAIFHGRQSELEDITTSLIQQSAHIAILGAGGIGKTSLARAALHHPQVAAKYENRFFIAADLTTTGIELAALTGSYLGLKPGKDLTQAVVHSLSNGPPCLLVLDNLETPWEPVQSHGGVEEFLSLRTDIPHLALIITMRGAERPAKVRWTRPFLEPLKPLSYEAARQTFIEIADGFHDSKEIDQLLQLTDNMPLAVDLIAHLVDYEGCSTVLAHWEKEKTSLLSAGHDKQSSLNIL